MQLIYYYESNAVRSLPDVLIRSCTIYFKKDLENGTLSLEEAEDIVSGYWLKLAETNKVYTEGESRYRTEIRCSRISVLEVLMSMEKALLMN